MLYEQLLEDAQTGNEKVKLLGFHGMSLHEIKLEFLCVLPGLVFSESRTGGQA